MQFYANAAHRNCVEPDMRACFAPYGFPPPSSSVVSFPGHNIWYTVGPGLLCCRWQYLSQLSET